MPSRRRFFLILLLGFVNGLSVIFVHAESPHKNFSALTIAAVDTFYISPAGSNITGAGAKNSPWRSLGFALSKVAADSLNPKAIKLANGIYSAATTGESFPINLKNWVALVGNDSLNTIIDAARAARAIVGLGAANVVMSRLTIRNGFAKADTGDASRGGGVMLRHCRKITLKSCVLLANEAKTQGGGVFLGGGSDLTLENNLLENNLASDGAGVYCSRITAAKLLANIIQRNLAQNSAGGVYIDVAAPVLQRNRIRRNNANRALPKNAGGIVVRSANPIIGGSLETGNDIHDNLGGESASQLYVINNTMPINARYNYWGATPTSRLVLPAAFVDLSNYRNLAINIPLGTSDFYVTPSGSDANNGGKNTPWRTLGHAFSQIFATSIDSLTINLAAGVYSIATNGEQFPIYTKSHITVLGTGISGAATIISGEGVLNGALVHFEEVTTLRLANLFFRNYKANDKSGAILARFSSDLIIENCRFEDNQSQRGAALTLIKVKSSEIRNNVFRRNHSAGTGGAVALVDDATNLAGNIFAENSAVTGGGAVHCDSTSQSRFLKNDFQNNSAGFGGAVYVTLSNIRIFNNRLRSNQATVAGGGAIALDGASLPEIGTRDTQANDIYLNVAKKGGSQIYRLEPGIKVDARYNYWGQIPDSTLLSPFGQFAVDNFRQVAARMPSDTREIYVSPAGDDAATGVSRHQALRTVTEALRLVLGLGNNPITVRLLPGKFSAATNGETFPISLESYINLRGSSRDSTTIDAANGNRVFEGRDVIGCGIADLNIVGGKAPGYGGAIWVGKGMTAAAKKAVALTIENCLLQSNAAIHGGALAAVHNYKTVVRNCVIASCTAQQHGGAVLALGDSVEIKDSEFYFNRAQQDGGAVHVDSAAVLTLTGNRIHDNFAAQGGGVAVTHGESRIWRNFIIDNTAQNGVGGGIFFRANGKAVIGGASNNGNDIYGNRAPQSGKELGSTPRSDKIEARFNFFGGKPAAVLVDNPASFDVSSFRYVTITAPEKNREFYVSPKGSDTNSGVSKNSPWKTMTAALRRFFTEPGDSVRLHLLNGTYSTSATGERLPIYLTPRVTLSGQNADSVIVDGAKATRLFEINFAAHTRLQNLTITNGWREFPGTTDFSLSAGGVRIHKSVLIYFNHVTFRGNKTNGEGGAISADSSQQVFIDNCRFLENQGRGGALFFHRIGGEIRGSEFRQNRSPDNGAAIYLSESSPQITGNVIVGNEVMAGEGSAIFCTGSIVPVIGGAAGWGNDLYNNTGGSRGRALGRQGNTPVINATYNYFGAGAITDTLVYPLTGFDVRFKRTVPIVTNGKPIITKISPPANQPLRASRFDTVRFQIAAYDPDNDLITYTWTLDDEPAPVGFGANYSFFPFFINLGAHSIRVVVSDQKDTVAVHWQVLVSTTGVNEPRDLLPQTFALQQNFPNPLRNAAALTVIPYQIPKATDVVLAVYDLLGRRVRLLEQSRKAPGMYSAFWDGLDQSGGRVESGIYFVRLQAGEFTGMRKILVTR